MLYEKIEKWAKINFFGSFQKNFMNTSRNSVNMLFSFLYCLIPVVFSGKNDGETKIKAENAETSHKTSRVSSFLSTIIAFPLKML